MATRMGAQRRTKTETAHRPWPLPERPWLMGQTWDDLLFAHWSLPPEALERVLPPQLPLETFDGRAWFGVTPFVVRAARARLTPPLPWLSRFPEMNLRTYVNIGGRPGIYFLSLEAARLPAVFGARRGYRVPYFHADMDVSRDDGWIRYRSDRRQGDGPAAAFEGDYRPTGPVAPATPGTLDYFLAERYCLYTLDAERRVQRADIHHPPWPLQEAAAEIERNTMGRQIGVELEGEPLLHFAQRQDVLIWPRRDHHS